ncbi:MAG: ATP-binding cassette domain-containing protein [Lachnospiraceae bacterium]|nr:ATP-binding cassette domain-containing protein [Lachnospiraceae bacterium]
MLTVKNLSFLASDQDGEKEIIKDVSFELEQGEMLVITGPNGGGKSTLAKLIMGIELPDQGSIFLDGTDLTSLSIDERAKAGIGYAFQQPPRFKGMTIQRFLSLSAGEDLSEEECCRLLSGVGLCAREYLSRFVDNTLSGGEMKRLEIASVLAHPHKIAVFDEPEAGIDLWSFSTLMKQFEKIHKEKKESLILISHQERIIRMADRIMVIKDGQIDMVGSRDDMLPNLSTDSPACDCMEEE